MKGNRLLPAILALVFAAGLGRASRAQSRTPGEPVVETTVALDAAALAEGKLDGLALEGRALALARGRTSGTLETPEVAARTPFDRLCASLNAETDGAATVEVLVRILLDDGTRTGWLSLGIVGAPDEAARVPRSVEGPASGPAKVAIDTIELAPGPAGAARGRAFALRLVVSASGEEARVRVRRLAAVAWPRRKRDPERERAPASHPAWGKVLEVPERSQRVEDAAIEGRICSPTSLSMVLAFHGVVHPTREVARQVLDRAAGIYGNWALNVAYAGRLGLDAEIVRCGSFAPLEAEIAAGRPAVISHRWSEGELTGSPVSATDGHLICVRGFTREGDVVVNDPAADPRRGQPIERTYLRRDLARTWLENGDGIAYFVRKSD